MRERVALDGREGIIIMSRKHGMNFRLLSFVSYAHDKTGQAG